MNQLMIQVRLTQLTVNIDISIKLFTLKSYDDQLNNTISEVKLKRNGVNN